MSSLAAGATLCEGRYRLDAVVGRGGMAIVWRATDLQLERDVALKVISDVLASDPSFVARFEREARLAAALNHPNLVKVFDFSIEEERPFLVMEFIGGGTLAEARGQTLDVDSLARQLLDAVAHIHAAGIVHRDIKPANVLLDDHGSPRLTDFGIARGEDTTGLTQTGQVLGTLRYIAPEVAEGRPATVRSDLYGLGVLLGELTGTRSSALERLLERMTDRDPANRPRSAGEALPELDPTRMLPADTNPDEQQGGQAPYTGESYGRVRGQAAPSGMRVDRRSGARPPALRSGFALRRSHAVAAALVLAAVLALVIAAGSGGSDDSKKLGIPDAARLQPAPAGAPADAQIDRLERIVRSARKQP